MGGFERVTRLAAAGVLVGCHLASTSSATVEMRVQPGRSVGVGRTVVARPASVVAGVTGASSINRTDERWQIKGTDLGVMWQSGAGDILVAFGDTFGRSWQGHGSVATPDSSDWRSNTLARSSDRHLADGMTLDRFAQNVPGHARELMASRKVDADEMTVVPTAGIAVGDRNYVHYMSVRSWGEHGRWTTNHSGIAYSDDNGVTWVKDPRTRWPNEPAAGAAFQMAAYAHHDGAVYVFGTPAGRTGALHLARVPDDEVLEPNAYRYWDGAAWSPLIADAAPIVAGPVGETSVQYNAYLDRWTMLHSVSGPGPSGDAHVRAVVLRTADTPTGPWSPAQELVTDVELPGLYAPFMHPWSAASGDADLYFTMSLWEPYNVYLMKTTLSLEPRQG